MTPRQIPWMKNAQAAQYGVLIGIVVILALLLKPWINDDVAWCRRVFTGLAQGSQYIQDSIAWERFKALDADIGAQYRELPNTNERSGYREAFVNRFARGFRESKAQISDFMNWRIVKRSPDGIIVAADYPAKQSTLLFDISKAGGRRLETMRWQ